MLYVVYANYTLNRLLSYIKVFHKKEVLSDDHFYVLETMYTGMMKHWQFLPSRREYPLLYENTEFNKFAVRVRRLSIFFLITGGGFCLYTFLNKHG